MPTLLLITCYVPVVLLIARLVRLRARVPEPRPAVLAAAQRGLHQRDQRSAAE